MASQLLNDFRQVIADATSAELETVVRVMILDALDDGRIGMCDAHQLLSQLQQRLAGMSDDTTKEQQHG